MRTTMTSCRAAWMAAGLIAGAVVACVCPHEPSYASAADREIQFLTITVPVRSKGADEEGVDAVFTLDFFTGQLRGAALNLQARRFTSFWTRNLRDDFGLKDVETPRFAVVSGHSQLPPKDGITFSPGVLFVSELTSGKVAAYGIPWSAAGQIVPVPLTLVDSYPFGKASQKE